MEDTRFEELTRLRRENEQYRQLLSDLPVGVLMVSHPENWKDGHILESNDELTRMTGYTMKEFKFFDSFLALVDERDREALTDSLSAQLAVSDHYEVTYRLPTKSGVPIWVRENGRLCRGETLVRHGAVIDISAQMWHQEQLAQSEQLFRITNNASGGAVFDFDFSTGTYLHFENAERIYGVPAGQIIADTQWFGTLSPQKSTDAMIDYFYHPDDAELVASAFARLSKENAVHYTARSKRADGTFLWTQVHIALIRDTTGCPVRRVGNLQDIDELKRHADEMAQSEQLFRITNNASGGAVFDFDLATGTYLHFENTERIYGVSSQRIISDTKWFGTLKPERALNAMISYFYHPDDSYLVAGAFQRLPEEGAVTYVARSRRTDGSYIWSRIHIALIYDNKGNPVRRVGHILDIDEMTKQMETLRSQAQEDPLTGIYNKTAAQAIVDTVLKKKDNEISALMVLDIDNFKGVNDTLGHAVGDTVLVDVCDKLKTSFPNQTLGRVGGDEFIIFAMALRDEAAVLEKAEQICRLFRETYIGPNHDYKISCSIGIAISSNETTFMELFKKADTALYRAKAGGKDCFCLYEEYGAS